MANLTPANKLKNSTSFSNDQVSKTNYTRRDAFEGKTPSPQTINSYKIVYSPTDTLADPLKGKHIPYQETPYQRSVKYMLCNL